MKQSDILWAAVTAIVTWFGVSHPWPIQWPALRFTFQNQTFSRPLQGQNRAFPKKYANLLSDGLVFKLLWQHIIRCRSFQLFLIELFDPTGCDFDLVHARGFAVPVMFAEVEKAFVNRTFIPLSLVIPNLLSGREVPCAVLIQAVGQDNIAVNLDGGGIIATGVEKVSLFQTWH